MLYNIFYSYVRGIELCLKNLKSLLLKGNVLDLAIAVVMGDIQ